MTSARSRPSDLEAVDAVVHLAALSNDPLGEFDESLTLAINLEATSSSQTRTERRRRALRVRLSCSMYGASGSPPRSTRLPRWRRWTAYEVSRCASRSRWPSWPGRLLSGLPPLRDRLRRLAELAPRHRPQQPRRFGGGNGCGRPAERRYGLEAADPCRGHGACASPRRGAS